MLTLLPLASVTKTSRKWRIFLKSIGVLHFLREDSLQSERVRVLAPAHSQVPPSRFHLPHVFFHLEFREPILRWQSVGCHVLVRQLPRNHNLIIFIGAPNCPD